MSTTSTSRTECFLWPDHVIGKRESRAIREAHNATVNELHEVRAALASVTAQRDQCREALRNAEKILAMLDASGGPILCSATLCDARAALRACEDAADA